MKRAIAGLLIALSLSAPATATERDASPALQALNADVCRYMDRVGYPCQVSNVFTMTPDAWHGYDPEDKARALAFRHGTALSPAFIRTAERRATAADPGFEVVMTLAHENLHRIGFGVREADGFDYGRDEGLVAVAAHSITLRWYAKRGFVFGLAFAADYEKEAQTARWHSAKGTGHVWNSAAGRRWIRKAILSGEADRDVMYAAARNTNPKGLKLHDRH